MTEQDIRDLIDILAKDPMIGDEITGTGGCRKFRFIPEKSNKGKSGSARIITFYTGKAMPVFLIAAFAKGDKVNLTKGERNALRVMTKRIADEYAAKGSTKARGARK